MLSASLAFALRNNPNGKNSSESVLDLLHSIYSSWQRSFIDPNLALRTSDGSAIEHAGRDMKTLYSAVVTPLLLSTVFHALKSIDMPSSDLLALEGESLRSAHSRLGELTRSFSPPFCFKIEPTLWRKLCQILEALIKQTTITIQSCDQTELYATLASDSSFHKGLWENANALRDVQRGLMKEDLGTTLKTTFKGISDMMKWLDKPAPDLENAQHVPNLRTLPDSEPCYKFVLEVLRDGLSCIRLCMDLGLRISTTLYDISQSWDLSTNYVHRVTGSPGADLWTSNVIPVLTLGILGSRSGRFLRSIYDQTVVALYLNRLNRESGKRLSRAPLRIFNA